MNYSSFAGSCCAVLQEAQGLCLEEFVRSCVLSCVCKYACTHVMQALSLDGSLQLQAFCWLPLLAVKYVALCHCVDIVSNTNSFKVKLCFSELSDMLMCLV